MKYNLSPAFKHSRNFFPLLKFQTHARRSILAIIAATRKRPLSVQAKNSMDTNDMHQNENETQVDKTATW